MPKRTDIKKIMLIGSGPIVIGQACEFDYSGTQACKALKEEGFEVVLVNSNPATIMTDPEFAHRTYVEPITTATVAKILAAERPDALLPTLGGQTALNVGVELAESGVLEKYNVELIGASLEAIKKAEDRQLFKEAMVKIGLGLPMSGYAHSMADAWEIIAEVGYPAIIRPSFTLGGTGGNIAYNVADFERYVKWGLELSPTHEILIEESIIGWKEYELEVMRDHQDNVVIICSIENVDAMGIHTGDSITVAPAQTLTDKEYQIMRDAAIRVIREIGVDTGGSNVQFAVNPQDGRLVIIEMNPRVSRSSALASKATGFPIAKIAAKLAVGYTLDEIPNDITRETPASFEPTIDYVVTKIPRFTFEKFPQADATLTVQMKSVGEVMAIGRTFKESLQKAMRSLEIDSCGFDEQLPAQAYDAADEHIIDLVEEKLRIPGPDRLWYIGDALRLDFSLERVAVLTGIDPWFIYHIKEIIDFEKELLHTTAIPLDADTLQRAKEMGFADGRLAALLRVREEDIFKLRNRYGIMPVYKRVDTCAAEFEAHTPYLYSTYECEDEALPTDRRKVIILGGGPNRIGQGIEFDYCCVHCSFALALEDYETIMVNCNPETVSTDYDTSDRLYFEPLTHEDVLQIVKIEQPVGVIVQFGGQTPLKLAGSLEQAGVPILGTSPDSIDRAEDRQRFKELLELLNLRQPENGTAVSVDGAIKIATGIGYPVLVRPSYVLGGRGMEIVYDQTNLERYMKEAVKVSFDHPVLIDRFLDDAVEVDVDAVCDGEQVIIGGIMEHIERAGVHSGDSACSLPPYTLADDIIQEIARQTRAMALELQVRGLMNVQFAVQGDQIYIIEVNPRASRTVPFVSKAVGLPLADLAARIMVGRTLAEMKVVERLRPPWVSVKEAVFPFLKFPGVDTMLGPEMKSTGEVMGIDEHFAAAFAKAQDAAGAPLPLTGCAFVSVHQKPGIEKVVRDLLECGYIIRATAGTSAYLDDHGLANIRINKKKEGRPNVVDSLVNGEIDLVINTPGDSRSREDSLYIRRTALDRGVAYFTTLSGATAAAQAIKAIRTGGLSIKALQDYR
ncbi:MAG: carbamoyl-phosphate synthase large subunit [Deltaproteobacteria bacterium]|nr:carbamoyl-phosphate synthase large subunit [Candidatus Anaeroferrophillus wilburensis]MBN2889893.1 carbamoyl-phosphate synthase large subunit [Deltaproteobacteria bacterium]